MTKRVIESRKNDYSAWYNDIVIKAGLAEHSDVRGCMVIKPYGFSIWENIQRVLDEMFKATGHKNAYFPLFIPKSYLSKEASHVKGFAKECAVVTHYRLKLSDDKKNIVVDENAKLDEELIVRPTSETIIWNTYKKWIRSYRDLPILLNQWANVVRWEMRTRLFLRTSEFLWQEGHTAHESEEEAKQEALKILDIYADFLENWMAIPVLKGKKSENEKFAGAVDTYCVEALMQDKKALQAGTSHFLGQNFAKAFDVKFTNRFGKEEYVWASSWGVSTRLMGALIMTHSDDKGLVLPPKLAPVKVVIVPVFKNQDEYNNVINYAEKLIKDLKKEKIEFIFDNDQKHKPGWKFAEYELKGIPVRITIGPKDIQNGTVEIYRRDTSIKEVTKIDNIGIKITKLLKNIQNNLYNKALSFREKNTFFASNYNEFKKMIKEGGFVYAFWDGTTETEEKIKEESKATIRCIPFSSKKEKGKCIYTNKDTDLKVVFARAY